MRDEGGWRKDGRQTANASTLSPFSKLIYDCICTPVLLPTTHTNYTTNSVVKVLLTRRLPIEPRVGTYFKNFVVRG